MKIFGSKFEGGSSLTWWIYRKWRRYAMRQQIVVKRGYLKLLIVNLLGNTGLCHSVTFARKTSVVGSNKRELK